MRRLALLLLASASADASDVLDRYVELATGSFDSSAQARADERYDTAIWHIADVPSLGGDDVRWLYAENWIDGGERPYRQRLIKIATGPRGTLIAASFRLPEPERFVGAWQDPSLLAAIDVGTLTSVTGCESIVTRAGAYRFEASTRGHDCRNSYKGADYVLSRSVITPERMTNWDRGFDSSGNLRWGPATGGYEFRRRNTTADR